MTDLNIVPKVVDLSHYDDLQDIQKVKAAGIVGVVNKATEGPGAVDKTFALRRPVVLGAGLAYGAYHFLRPGNMQVQAKHFLDVVGDPTGLHLMADWEVGGIPVSALKEWLQAVFDATGQWPSVYSYASMLIEQLGNTKPDPFLANTRLWLAAYSMHPVWPKQIWSTPWLWQFTGDGNGPGVHQIPGIVLAGSRGIDIDAYEGGNAHSSTHTDDELLATWAGGIPVTPHATPQEDPLRVAPVAHQDAIRQRDITATVFGGKRDHETSAYDGHVITDTELGVSLPARVPAGSRTKVRLWANGESVLASVVDVGPWNTNDPYWLHGTRPQAETGTDMRGRHTNHAGIDLTPATAKALKIDGMGKVDWAFEG